MPHLAPCAALLVTGRLAIAGLPANVGRETQPTAIVGQATRPGKKTSQDQGCLWDGVRRSYQSESCVTKKNNDESICNSNRRRPLHHGLAGYMRRACSSGGSPKLREAKQPQLGNPCCTAFVGKDAGKEGADRPSLKPFTGGGVFTLRSFCSFSVVYPSIDRISYLCAKWYVLHACSLRILTNLDSAECQASKRRGVRLV